MPIGWFVSPTYKSVAAPAKWLARQKMRAYRAYLQQVHAGEIRPALRGAPVRALADASGGITATPNRLIAIRSASTAETVPPLRGHGKVAHDE